MVRDVVYRYRGKEYRLMFNLYAVEEIEDLYGGVRQAMQELQGGKQFTALRNLFRILANAALIADDQEPTITGKEILKADLREMTELSDAVRLCFLLGRKTETEAGEAGSDERRELYDDEEDEKNG